MKQTEASGPYLLGIESGGTRTVAILAQAGSREHARSEMGPANLRLLNDKELMDHFSRIRDAFKAFPKPDALAIGMAGARTDLDRRRIRLAAAAVWPGVPCCATNDLATALAASNRGRKVSAAPQVLVLSGTGSCCFGQNAGGKSAKVGGWGHLLGDKGSGYEIGLRGLKAVVYYYDRDGVWPPLGKQILAALQLNEPNDLIAWAQSASKKEIAALAVEVFSAWGRSDRIASDIVTSAAHGLAKDAVSCARRLTTARTQVQFILAGGVLLKQPRFASMVRRQIKQLWRKAVVVTLPRESVWGAVELAAQLKLKPGSKLQPSGSKHASPAPRKLMPHSTALSPTEQRNPRSMNLDKLPLSAAIELMLKEDAQIPAALLAERKKIEQAIRAIARAFKRGGRLFYVGAGTSGRLGVLDASECPPTFRTPPQLVQGIIAGGQSALSRSIEGAEDDFEGGAKALEYRGVGSRDVVIGIAASGTTPFVWGALSAARKRRAFGILLCFNPHLAIPPKDRPALVIAPKIGPEILTGSTRLKAGTATKLVLNLLTTLSMVQIGKVMGNLMVDLNPSNVKLRLRAIRIVEELTGANAVEAEDALQKANWIIKQAVQRLKGFERARQPVTALEQRRR